MVKKDNSSSKTFEKKLNDFLHTIGDNLYALRMNSNVMLNTVAKAVKISPAKLSKIEKGLCPHCRFGTLVVLCKYYEVKLTDIATKGKFKVRNGATVGKKKNELHKNEKTKQR